MILISYKKEDFDKDKLLLVGTERSDDVDLVVSYSTEKKILRVCSCCHKKRVVYRVIANKSLSKKEYLGSIINNLANSTIYFDNYFCYCKTCYTLKKL